MAGIKGMTQACTGMTDEEVLAKITKQYADFCSYRWELASRMPDFRTVLFNDRIFNGDYFEKQ